jgi:probable phosphoglycerate mutase
MTTRRLILVRHGESVWNVEQRVQGQTCRGLTDHGRAQAERTAEVVAARVTDALLITSDLGRCRDTAAPLAAALGMDPIVDVALRERSFGSWEGFTREDLEREDPERYRRWRAGEDVIAEVGGESDVDLRRRSSGVFSDLLAQDGPDTVVAVTHGGTIWFGVHELLGLSGARLGYVDNASVTELVLGPGGPAGPDPTLPRLARFNETAHLHRSA